MNPIISELPMWLQALIAVAPLGVLAVGVGGGAVALAGAFVAFLSYLQQRRAAIRTEWWKRVQFGMEIALSSNRRSRRVGSELLSALAYEKEVTRGDAEFLRRIVQSVRDTVADNLGRLGGAEQGGELFDVIETGSDLPAVVGLIREQGLGTRYEPLPGDPFFNPGSNIWERGQSDHDEDPDQDEGEVGTR
ncbi:hypothetical protein [Brachybacterium paraconglomeratum]|uniref:hypothetical protein n=1 Tax=Brachybacterium paraconglomeratum TaxID=173362 RepID=UPI003F7CBF0C